MKNKVFYILVAVILIGFFGKHIYQLPKYDSGEKAPEIEATLSNGDDFKLSSLEGKYVLLDFWGSWCGPCRADNPKLVSLWNKYSSKGLEIVSVGVEKNEKRWQRAIASDGLKWKYHIGEFNSFNSPITSAYGVKTIPTKYLIDPDGNIIGVNQEVEEIDQILSKALK